MTQSKNYLTDTRKKVSRILNQMEPSLGLVIDVLWCIAHHQSHTDYILGLEITTSSGNSRFIRSKRGPVPSMFN